MTEKIPWALAVGTSSVTQLIHTALKVSSLLSINLSYINKPKYFFLKKNTDEGDLLIPLETAKEKFIKKKIIED